MLLIRGVSFLAIFRRDFYDGALILKLFQVIDFGSSCYEHQRVYTYIQSRFYRAPEVILGARYGMPIDMWSLGCILAELLTGYPLLPGEDEGDQLSCIIELLGMPPQKLLDQSKRAKNFISSKGESSGTSLAPWKFSASSEFTSHLAKEMIASCDNLKIDAFIFLRHYF